MVGGHDNDPALRAQPHEYLHERRFGAGIEEGVKWNSLSFRTRGGQGEWFATVNLREKQGVGLILRFGAKKNALSETGVAIADPAGLLRWLAKDL